LKQQGILPMIEREDIAWSGNGIGSTLCVSLLSYATLLEFLIA
jgi:hypothetical protein